MYYSDIRFRSFWIQLSFSCSMFHLQFKIVNFFALFLLFNQLFSNYLSCFLYYLRGGFLIHSHCWCMFLLRLCNSFLQQFSTLWMKRWKKILSHFFNSLLLLHLFLNHKNLFLWKQGKLWLKILRCHHRNALVELLFPKSLHIKVIFLDIKKL